MNVLIVELPSGDLDVIGPFQFRNQAEGWAKENVPDFASRVVTMRDPLVAQWGA